MNGINQTQIYIDNELVKTCLSSSCSYLTAYLYEGNHTYYAKAVDNSANQNFGTSETKTFTVLLPVSIPVDTTPPLVNINHTPENPILKQQIYITATASDESGIKEIKIYVDNSFVKTCTTLTCVYSKKYTSTGTHTYYATAIDNSANQNFGTSETGTFSVSKKSLINRILSVFTGS